MRIQWVLYFLGFVLAMTIGVVFILILKNPLQEEVRELALIQPATPTIPHDFDWETYVQNYEDLRRAGINTEEKARQHWVEFGKSEGRDYHPVAQVKQTESVAKAEDAFAISPIVPPRTIPLVSLDSSQFDPTSFRERYNKILKRAGIDSKEEAMEFSLCFWEKRRKAYFS
jgi:hypothetical protein